MSVKRGRRRMPAFDVEMNDQGGVKTGWGWWAILIAYFVAIVGVFGCLLWIAT